MGVAQHPIYQFCGHKKNISYPRLLNSWLAKFIPQPRIIIADMFVMGILAYIYSFVSFQQDSASVPTTIPISVNVILIFSLALFGLNEIIYTESRYDAIWSVV